MQHPDITTVLVNGELTPNKPVYHCDLCNYPIYAGYEFYLFQEGEIICQDCKYDYLYDLAEKAERIAKEE